MQKETTPVNGSGREDASGAESGANGAAPARIDGLRLAELLAARLCHEVSGPAGTLSGALEIAHGDPASAAEALGIATAAAAALAVRLRLLRAAWAGGVDDLDLPGLRKLCAGLPRQIGADLQGFVPDRSFPAGAARLLLNLLLLAAESLPRGGVVVLGEAGPDTVMVLPRGRDAAWPPGLAAWMADPAPAWRAVACAAPRGLQGPLTALMAHAAGARLSFAFAADTEGAPPLMLRLP